MQITYQKSNGCIIQRLRNTVPPYKIGETTSMGWKVLNIEYEYQNKFYSKYEYDMLIRNEKQTAIKKQQTIESVSKKLKAFICYFVAAVIVSFLKTLLGI